MSKWKNGQDGKTRKRKGPRIEGQFAGRPIEMLESPTFRALGLDERRMLDRSKSS